MEKPRTILASLRQADKSFGKTTILNNISLTVRAGTILGLIGPSGAGKTTAIKCLLGMEQLDQGTTEILNTPMPNRKILQKIGYMGQNEALYESLSARENLIFFGNLMGLKGNALAAAIHQNMKLVVLSSALDQLVNTYSGGMKRRLSLAVTLLSDPELLILDEPTVGIDPALRKNIWQQLRLLADRQNKAIILTTHVMDEAEKCDEVALIIEGKLLALGTPAELKQKFSAASIEEVFLKAEGKVK